MQLTRVVCHPRSGALLWRVTPVSVPCAAAPNRITMRHRRARRYRARHRFFRPVAARTIFLRVARALYPRTADVPQHSLSLPNWRHITDYHYFGLLLGKAKVTLALLSAVLPIHGTHVAVWLGVSNNARTSWVQAGVAEVAGGHPGVYVEWKSPGHYSLRSWRGSKAEVRIQRRGNRYRVLVGRHRSPWVVISGARRIACMEILGAASGTAQIDGRVIDGNVF